MVGVDAQVGVEDEHRFRAQFPGPLGAGVHSRPEADVLGVDDQLPAGAVGQLPQRGRVGVRAAVVDHDNVQTDRSVGDGPGEVAGEQFVGAEVDDDDRAAARPGSSGPRRSCHTRIDAAAAPGHGGAVDVAVAPTGLGPVAGGEIGALAVGMVGQPGRLGEGPVEVGGGQGAS